MRGYLRFDVQGLSTGIKRVTLRIFVNSNSAACYIVNGVTDNTWTELGINSNNAPSVGGPLGSAANIIAGTWATVDITPYITGNGTYSIALTTPGSTAISLSSRESSNDPQLIIETAP